MKQSILIQYFGLVAAIKPPVGWPPWAKPSIAKRIRYAALVIKYRFDAFLFKRYGQSVADEWYRTFRGGSLPL